MRSLNANSPLIGLDPEVVEDVGDEENEGNFLKVLGTICSSFMLDSPSLSEASDLGLSLLYPMPLATLEAAGLFLGFFLALALLELSSNSEGPICREIIS